MPSWMYPWREPGRKYLRRVQPENMTAKRKKVMIDALMTAGVLLGWAAPDLGSALFGSYLKGREPSQFFRYWRFVTMLERGKVPMVGTRTLDPIGVEEVLSAKLDSEAMQF